MSILFRLPISNKFALHHNARQPPLFWKITHSPTSNSFIVRRLSSDDVTRKLTEQEQKIVQRITEIQKQADDLYKEGKKKFEDILNPDPSLVIQLWTEARALGSMNATYSLASLRLEDNFYKILMKDDPEDPIAAIEKLATHGHLPALTKLAYFYITGLHGIRIDHDMAILLYKHAVTVGDIHAPYNLYLMYLKKDKEIALKWLMEAANNGYVLAKLTLGNYYNMGVLVKKDPERATQLFREAADQNNIIAAHNFACACLIGRGIEVSPSLALRYFRIAADAGYLPSKMNLAEIYAEGKIVGKDLVTAKMLYREVLMDENEKNAKIREDANKFLLEIS